jgi:hypothetical protein
MTRRESSRYIVSDHQEADCSWLTARPKAGYAPSASGADDAAAQTEGERVVGGSARMRKASSVKTAKAVQGCLQAQAAGDLL